ncbi:venom acid phosphatase Acph-1, partial [Asbolus verrucosus]
MNYILGLFYCLAFFSAVASANPVVTTAAKKDTLVLLHVLFRHGNRAPDLASMFPSDPHANNTYHPHGFSQLTLKGKETEYKIGKYIREKYGKLIPEQYTPGVVYAISTNMKRTKMSLQLVLASLFPPLESDVFEEGLNWQPIPYNVEPGQGLIGVPMAYCPAYIIQYYKYVMSEEGQAIIAEYQNFYDELSKYTGSRIITPKDAANIYFTLKSEEDYDLKLPEWSAGIYPEVLEEAASVDYEFSTATSGLKKYSAGFLLKKILDDSKLKADGELPEERKIFLYSAHEFNVGAMLRTLNVFYRHVPPFGATIYFEIHYMKAKYGLKLYYQDYTEEAPRLLTIPGCAAFCPLNKVYELLGDSLPDDNDACSTEDEIM